MKRTLHTVIVAATMGLAGCIVEFDPNLNANPDPLLVVEGTITDGETVISLGWSRSLKMSNEFREPPLVVGAEVWVESESGQSFPGTEKFEEITTVNQWGQTNTRVVSTGKHYVPTGTLDDNTRYRVRIVHLEEEYVSQWRPPQATPPIEQIELHGEGSQVQLRLDVTGSPDGARSYMWRFEETWETQAEINATHYYGMWDGDYLGDVYHVYSVWDALVRPTTPRPRQFSYPEYISPYFYCWKRDESHEVLIAETSRVSENALRDHVLFEFINSDDRLSVLYHIKLYQYAIADDAFLYLNNLKENTDNTGSIFAPIPSEMIGNLSCTTSPETHVIGFVEVSHGVVTEQFFESRDTPYQPVISCETISWEQLIALGVSDDPNVQPTRDHFMNFYLALGDETKPAPEIDSYFAPLRCIDCRALDGTKNRPDWWPNNHY